MNLFERVVEGNFRLIMAPFKIAEKLLSDEVPKRKKDYEEDYDSLSIYEQKRRDHRAMVKSMRLW